MGLARKKIGSLRRDSSEKLQTTRMQLRSALYDMPEGIWKEHIYDCLRLCETMFPLIDTSIGNIKDELVKVGLDQDKMTRKLAELETSVTSLGGTSKW